MKTSEFLEANKDPASPISRLGFDEFRNWMLLFAYWEGKAIRPIVSQTREQLEQMLLTTELTMPDDGADDAHNVFKLIARITPLRDHSVPKQSIVSPTEAATDSAKQSAMLQLRTVLLANAPENEAASEPTAPVEARPPEAPVPPPASAEDSEAVQTLTAEFARLSAKSRDLFALASPAKAIVEGIQAELRRQIDNLTGQQQFIAGRTDLKAFPVKLQQVLDELAFNVRRCQALLLHIDQQATMRPKPKAPALPPRTAAPPPIAASPAPPQRLTALQPVPVAAYQAHLAEMNVKFQAEMKKRQTEFERGQEEHRKRMALYQEQNKRWEQAFFGASSKIY